MSKPPCLAAAELSRERVISIDILKQQLLDLEALREKVVEAERASAEKKKRKRTLLLPQ